MNINEVVTLLNAGFTREEILAMTSTPEPAPAPEPVPAPAPAPEPVPAPVPAADAPEPAPAPVPITGVQAWDALMNEIVSLRQAVQAGNRYSAQQPENKPPDGEAVLANIIKPVKGKK